MAVTHPDDQNFFAFFGPANTPTPTGVRAQLPTTVRQKVSSLIVSL